MMHPLSEKVLAQYQVRKTRKQKAAFRAFLTEQLAVEGYTVKEEPASFGGVNMVIGNVNTAEMVFTAHYDTCARLPVPNFLAPKNIVLSIAYQLLLAVIILVLMSCVGIAAGFLFENALAASFLMMVAVFGLIWLMIAGPANPHTANDNTSGVITLLEVMHALPEDKRSKAAFVFFDLEEAGLIGSAAFIKQHREVMTRKLLINLDCVSDGDHFLMVTSRRVSNNAKLCGRLDDALQLSDGKTKEQARSGQVLYPSDQAHFPISVAMVALKHKRFVGYYLNRIHTAKDTAFDRENIRILSDWVVQLMR